MTLVVIMLGVGMATSWALVCLALLVLGTGCNL